MTSSPERLARPFLTTPREAQAWGLGPPSLREHKRVARQTWHGVVRAGRGSRAGAPRLSIDAQNAIAALRQAGFAQIGVASRDGGKERKLSEQTETRTGVAATPDATKLQQSGGESVYADIEDIHGTLLAAHLSEHEATHYCGRLEHNGILVTVAAPADRWPEAHRVPEDNGGDSDTEIPQAAPKPVTTHTPVETNIPNPAQQGTVEVRHIEVTPEPTPQEDFQVSRGMGPIELRGTLLTIHRSRSASRPSTESDAARRNRKIA